MEQKPIQILLVEDNPGDARLLRESLAEATGFAYDLTHVERLGRGLAALGERSFDVVLLDLSLADAQGLSGLRRAHAAHPCTPIVVLTGSKDEMLALEAVQMGAQDYLVKGQTESRLLVRSIRYAIERTRADETSRRLVRAQTAHATASAERARLHALFMQAPVAICVLTGPEHTFELANPGYLQLIGKSQVVGKTLLAALPELAGQGFAELLDGVLRTGQPFVGRGALCKLDLRGDGTLDDRYVDFVYEPMRNGEGLVVGIMVVASDVTDTVLANLRVEEARKQANLSEERFQFLAEAIPQIVWSMDASGQAAYLSPRWYLYTGQSEDEPLASKWSKAIHPDDYQRCFALFAQASANRSLWELEYRLRRADGVYRWHLGRSVPHCAPDGAIMRWYGTATDIDEQRKAIRSRDDLLATVSHDLRNPLESISLATALLRRAPEQTDVSASVARHTAVIARSAARMEQLIRDLLDMASIESGHLSMEPKPIAVREIVEEALEAIRPLAAAKGILLDGEGVSPQLYVQCDKGRVLQVLSNILGNAVKFTGPSGKIGLSAWPDEDFVNFAVSDTGPGIESDQLPRVFDRFWQAKETARAGTGLGLAICKGIIEQHGGTIRVESTLGAGTIFIFSLKHANEPPRTANEEKRL